MPKKQPPDQRADTRGGQWAGIPHAVLDSAAYGSLGLMARAALVEIVRRFNGYNNGEIVMSFDDLSARLSNTNRRAIGAALAELVEHGLIEVGAAANRKHHKARAYRLTFISTGGPGRHVPATNAYRDWSPPPADAAPIRSGKPAPVIREGMAII